MTDYKAAIEYLKDKQGISQLVKYRPEVQKHNETDPFYYLLESVIAQQVSFKVANIIHQRFCELFEGRPHEDELLELSEGDLRGVGLSRQKIAYVKNVAEFRKEGGLEEDTLHAMNDKEVIKHLTQVKGIGQWTAEMVLMFPLDRPDIFPKDDLGIIYAVRDMFELKEEGKDLKNKAAQVTEEWGPYRTVACKYLWNAWD